MMKTVFKIIALVLAVIIPLISVPLVAVFSAPEFQDSFVGALDSKVDRLMNIEEDKIVIVGGSSVAFGYDSDIIEKYVGMPVVNFGLYAALGTKLMLDLSREGIRDGDIVILAPELDSQTLSMYFSAETTLRAFDGSPELYRYIDFEHIPSLIGSSWSFLGEKLKYKLGAHPEYSGVYSADSFDEKGDIVYERQNNIMKFYCDPNLPISLSNDIGDTEFFDYLNEYIDYCRSKGAEVYFEYCPMNRLAIDERNTAQQRREFCDFLQEKIDCTFIAPDIEDYIYNEGYFYDTNFHLNDAGVIKHTVNVTRDILLELGIPTVIDEAIPDPPPLPESDIRFLGEDKNTEMFEYSRLSDGTYMIVGVREEFSDRKELTIPLGYDSYKVTSIGRGAFAATSIEKLVITEDTNLRILSNGCFEDCKNLSEIWIYFPHESEILPPTDFNGTASDLIVYVPEGSTYPGGYYWSERGLKFEYIS